MAVVQYTFTHKKYTERYKTNNTQNNTTIIGRVLAVPRLGELYPGICPTTGEKARKNLSQGSRTIRIHRLNNKNTYITVLNRKTTYDDKKQNLKNVKECDNSKIHTYKQQLPIVYMSSNHVRHRIIRTITTLQHFATVYHTSSNCTSLQLSTLHFLSFTLHSPLIWLNPITFPIALFQLTSLN